MVKWLLKSAHGILPRTKLSLITVFLCFFGQNAIAACVPDRLDLRWEGGKASFSIEVADTDTTRARGLMFRASMPRFAGMLFVYDSPRNNVGFWMRNTEIPLDMLFFDPAGQMTRLHENAVPFDETVIEGGDNVQYILEINGGMSQKLGIKPGAEMRHPSLDQANAAWRCDSTE